MPAPHVGTGRRLSRSPSDHPHPVPGRTISRRSSGDSILNFSELGMVSPELVTHEPREAGEPPASRRHQRRVRCQHRRPPAPGGLSVPDPVAWPGWEAMSIKPVRPLAQERQPGRRWDPACSPRGPGRGPVTTSPPPDRTRGRPIGTDAQNHMEVVRQHSESRDLQAEEPGEGIQAVPNPGLAMIVELPERGSPPQRKALRTTR